MHASSAHYRTLRAIPFAAAVNLGAPAARPGASRGHGRRTGEPGRGGWGRSSSPSW